MTSEWKKKMKTTWCWNKKGLGKLGIGGWLLKINGVTKGMKSHREYGEIKGEAERWQKLRKRLLMDYES